jgi:hypothetical protein
VEESTAVSIELLHFSDEQISLCEEGSHLEFVIGCAAPEDSAGKVDACELKDSVLFASDVDFPSLCTDFGDSAYDQISYLWLVSTKLVSDLNG